MQLKYSGFKKNLLLKIFVFFVFTININLFSQEKTYNFINYKLNKLDFPGSGESFKKFSKKYLNLIENKNEKINIIHFGGSHVQADVFSNIVRSNLTAFTNNYHSGRGLIFPYSVAKTNNPSNYTTRYEGVWVNSKNIDKNIDKKIGLTGIVATTNDTNAKIHISIKNFDNIRYEFNSLKLLVSDTTSIIPSIKISDKTFSYTKFDPVHKYYQFEFDDFYSEFTILFSNFDSLRSGISISGILLENPNQKFNYHAVGVNGATLSSFLKCENLEQDIKLIKPDLIILSIGLNDSYTNKFNKLHFIKEYSKLIDKILKQSPECSIIFTTVSDNYYKDVRGKEIVNKSVIEANQAINELAKKYDAGVWDWYSIMGGLGSIKKWNNASLAKIDKVHFTDRGYKIVGELFSHAIINEINTTKKISDFSNILSYLKNIFLYKENSPLLFTQFYFWAFFTIVIAFFSLFYKKRLLRNTFLFFVSLFFYYKTSGMFLLILIFSTLLDFLCGAKIYYSKHHFTKKIFVVISVVVNLGVLAYFKYAYFFADTVNKIFHTDYEVINYLLKWTNNFTGSNFNFDYIILPIGISFYTFQTISYSVDIYRGKLKPVRNIFDFGFFVSFFPQLVAGPIVRASEFVPQLYKKFSLSKLAFGMAIFWILNGLIKKMILGDYLAVNFVDRVFSNPLLYSGFENLFALIGYSVQVYADFSGYTDIAIGVAMLMGFHLPLNFNSPYKAANTVDFWRRWHISLSTWLKDYLYIPLGGNKKGTFGTFFWMTIIIAIVLALSTLKLPAILLIVGLIISIVAIFLLIPRLRKIFITNVNIMITMLIGGLWHGASWNFMIWGGLNGVGILFYKFWKSKTMIFKLIFGATLLLIVYLWNFYAEIPLISMFYIISIFVFGGIVVQFLLSVFKLENKTIWLNRGWAVFITFMFITLTRLFFRSGSNLNPSETNQIAMETAGNMINQMGIKWNLELIPQMIYEYRFIFSMIAVGMIIHWLPSKIKQWYRINFAKMPQFVQLIAVVLTVFVIYQFITAELQPFIYFQF